MRFFEEIARREERNDDKIVLYPEGLFYKAYDRSAFACVSRISSFKPSKKRIKYCAREVASIGFPAAAIAKYFPSAPRPLSDGRVEITLGERIDTAACEAWKAALPLKERRPRGSSKAYLPTLGRGDNTGNLFVHPADLLPDNPALAAGTTGPKQPVRTLGGRGAVEQETFPGGSRGPATNPADHEPGAEFRGTGNGDRESGTWQAVRVAMPATAVSGDGSRMTYGTDGPHGSESGPAAGAETPARTAWLGRLLRKLLRPGRETDRSDQRTNHPGRKLDRSALQTNHPGRELDCLGQRADRQAFGPENRHYGEAELSGNAPTQPMAMLSREMAAGMLRTERSEALRSYAALASEKPAPPAENAAAGDAARPTTANPLLRWSAARGGALPTGRNETAAARTTRDPARRETKEERVARLIREFRLEAATPVECLLFVADLKKEIDGYL